MYEMYETLEKQELDLPRNNEPLTPLEMLYTVFEDHYDEASVDAAYLMTGCQFDIAYDLLMLPFWTAIDSETVQKVQPQLKPTPHLSHERSSPNKPTMEVSLADFIVTDKCNRRHRRK